MWTSVPFFVDSSSELYLSHSAAALAACLHVWTDDPGTQQVRAGPDPNHGQWPHTGTSAVKRSIGSTIGFHNHGEGPY